MSTTVATLSWTLKRGARLSQTIQWLDEDGAVRTPTEVAVNVREKPGGDILLTLAVDSGVTLNTLSVGKSATIVITEAQSTTLPVRACPFDIVPTIDGVQHTADAVDGTLDVTRAQGDI